MILLLVSVAMPIKLLLMRSWAREELSDTVHIANRDSAFFVIPCEHSFFM